MATAGVINGTLIGVYVGGTKINKGTSASLSINHSVRDITSKDSSAWSESLEGLRDWTIDFEGLFAFDSTYGIVDLEGVLTARTAVTVRFSTEVTADEYWEGTAFLTSLSADGATEESSTFSGSFQGTGALNFKALT